MGSRIQNGKRCIDVGSDEPISVVRNGKRCFLLLGQLTRDEQDRLSRGENLNFPRSKMAQPPEE